MPDRDAKRLAGLLSRRTAALACMGHRGATGKVLGRMTPEERVAADAASRAFREADAAIVDVLRARTAPVRVGKFVLHLTTDRRNFVACDPATGIPVYADDSRGCRETLLYRYPAAGVVRA